MSTNSKPLNPSDTHENSQPASRDEEHFLRVLMRCRLLITRSAVHRIGPPSEKVGSPSKDQFVAECHLVYKKAAGILIKEMLRLEDSLAKEGTNGQRRGVLTYWLRMFEFAYDSFVWIAANHDRSNVAKIYKGTKFGSLLKQNIHSVIETADELNASPNDFAFPLDFCRFSCIGDALRITRHPGGGVSLNFIEVKEGQVNERLLQAITTGDEFQMRRLYDDYGAKVVEQAKRMLKQKRTALRQLEYFDAKPGIYRGATENRIVSELKVGYGDRFDNLIEILMGRARRGEFSTEVVDDCLVVTALDSSSPQRHHITDFSSRVTTHTAFFDKGEPQNSDPDRLWAALQKIEFINWIESINSVVTIPLLLRASLSTRSFLDLTSGRIHLRFYFDPSSFLEICRQQKLQAGFIKKKITNRLRTAGRWKKNDCPLFDGRALGYIAGGFQGIIGWGFLHEILFNWRTPTAIARHLADTAGQLREVSSEQKGSESPWFSERDLETV